MYFSISSSYRRLSNDLGDTASELTLTKRKLIDCQKEVERMKAQLREYVQEIQRAEELLCVKVIRFPVRFHYLAVLYEPAKPDFFPVLRCILI